MIETVEDLLGAAPKFHHDPRGRAFSAHLGEEALLFISRQVRAESRTIETGAGYSTLVFALAGAQHTAVTPDQAEVDAISAFATANAVKLDSVRFIVERSDRALPRLSADSRFDLALVDGSHALPMPLLDWHYLAPLLEIGGLLLIDDTEVWPARVLRDFLSEEPAWRHEADLCVGRTAVFRKAAEQPPPRFWTDQPYVVSRSDLSMAMLRGHPVGFKAAHAPRLTRDVAVRAVRTALAYGRHLRDPAYPPPFRRRK